MSVQIYAVGLEGVDLHTFLLKGAGHGQDIRLFMRGC